MTWVGCDASVGHIHSHRTTAQQVWASECAHAHGLFRRSDGAGLVNGIFPSLSSRWLFKECLLHGALPITRRSGLVRADVKRLPSRHQPTLPFIFVS